ncbi:MAG: glycosyltransferase [Methylovulum sp.]|uniref:glycosyltransferase n=1 Tax=Methylovulum sp. TaxID=1916980 RepID=UPI0026093E7B|nr:glycosyltransferase [Methylovulum sp.]MDD2725316.1 glycosyltransferase [Methylovulum sp.]MDD5125895.1 glycosyltransferase [Methylovulum sp.]
MATTQSQALVSVVIATFNGGRFLQEQLNSIIRQTHQNLEIIAIDDCSTDNTASILSDYAAQYPNFTFVKNEQNIGYQKNFEKGFLLAKGEFIAPCDQDDIWLPTKIEVLLNNIGNHPIAYCDSNFINHSGELLGEKMSDAKALIDFDDPIMFVVGGSVAGHAMLITKQLVMETLPFPDKIMPHDYWLAFVATFYGSLKFIDQALVLYRRHDSNLFGSFNSKNKPRETSWQRITDAQQRVRLLYEKCPDGLTDKKEVFRKICKSYEQYSLANNFERMGVFFKYRKEILSYKKRNELRRCLYCLKVFFKII